jgi:hypothetical protein
VVVTILGLSLVKFSVFLFITKRYHIGSVEVKLHVVQNSVLDGRFQLQVSGTKLKLDLRAGQEILAEMEVGLSPQTELQPSRQFHSEQVRAPV